MIPFRYLFPCHSQCPQYGPSRYPHGENFPPDQIRVILLNETDSKCYSSKLSECLMVTGENWPWCSNSSQVQQQSHVSAWFWKLGGTILFATEAGLQTLEVTVNLPRKDPSEDACFSIDLPISLLRTACLGKWSPPVCASQDAESNHGFIIWVAESLSSRDRHCGGYILDLIHSGNSPLLPGCHVVNSCAL